MNMLLGNFWNVIQPTESPIEFVGSGLGHALNYISPSNYLFSGLRDENNLVPSLQENDFVLVNFGVASDQDRNFTAPNGYIEIEDIYINAPGAGQIDTNQCIWYKKMGAVPDTQITNIPAKINSADAGTFIVHVFRGVDTVTPIDVADVLASGLDTCIPNPGEITPASADGALVVVCCVGSTFGVPPNYTNPGDLSSGTNHFRAQTINDSRDLVMGTGFQGSLPNGNDGPFNPSVWGGGSTGVGFSWSAVTLALRPA